jgi:hypothetical protein
MPHNVIHSAHSIITYIHPYAVRFGNVENVILNRICVLDDNFLQVFQVIEPMADLIGNTFCSEWEFEVVAAIAVGVVWGILDEFFKAFGPVEEWDKASGHFN